LIYALKKILYNLRILKNLVMINIDLKNLNHEDIAKK
jgi:hypothetical protein